MKEYFAPILAAVGLAAFAVVFFCERAAFRGAVTDWARHDLEERTELAAETLAEPLRTSDFKKIHAFGDDCAADGVRLSVFTAAGGTVFDSERNPDASAKLLFAVRDCGEYRVRLGLPLSRVLAPYRRARAGVILAALAAGAGVLLVFFVTYRQHIRIAELARQERFRREFIADFSHELRTPLTGILGAADMLADGYNERLVGMIVRESKRLNSLAEDMLALARLDRVDASVEKHPTDLAALVRETTESLRPAAEAAGMALTVAAEGSVILDLDANAIARVVSNLISNAIRHSGSPDILVALIHDAEGAKIVVEDHGKGIPEEHAKRVFERFHRVDSSRNVESGGAGLGLAIAKKIVNLHGGDLVLVKANPKGCRFEVRDLKIRV